MQYLSRKVKFHLLLWAFLLLGSLAGLLLHHPAENREKEPESLSPDSPHRSPSASSTKYIV